MLTAWSSSSLFTSHCSHWLSAKQKLQMLRCLTLATPSHPHTHAYKEADPPGSASKVRHIGKATYTNSSSIALVLAPCQFALHTQNPISRRTNHCRLPTPPPHTTTQLQINKILNKICNQHYTTQCSKHSSIKSTSTTTTTTTPLGQRGTNQSTSLHQLSSHLNSAPRSETLNAVSAYSCLINIFPFVRQQQWPSACRILNTLHTSRLSSN